MRRWLVFLFLSGISLRGHADRAEAQYDCGPADRLALVFENGDINFAPGKFAQFTMHVVLINPSADAVTGMEFRIACPNFSSSLIKASETLPPGTINVGDITNPAQSDYCAGWNTAPLPVVNGQVVLMTWTMVALSTARSVDFFLQEMPVHSIPDSLTYLDASYALRAMMPITDSFTQPVARLWPRVHLQVCDAVTEGPASPESMQAASSGSNTIVTTWVDAADNESGFDVERKTASTGLWSLVTQRPTNSTTWTDTGLAPDQEYYYRVRARNSVGYSNYSNMARATAGAYLEPPTITSVEETPEGVLITWTPTLDPKVGYRIWRRSLTDKAAEPLELPNQCTADAHQTVDRGVLSNGPHEYFMRAYNIQTNSAASNSHIVDILGASLSQRTICVTMNGRPVPGASVYTGDDLGTFAGLTDTVGECTAWLKKGDKVRARYTVGERRTQRAAHEALDNVMYSVVLDSDLLTMTGHRHAPVVTPGGALPINLALGHPQFRLNFIVSSDYSIGPQVAHVAEVFQEASDFLAAVTDGYVAVDRVVYYDNLALNDVRSIAADVLFNRQLDPNKNEEWFTRRNRYEEPYIEKPELEPTFRFDPLVPVFTQSFDSFRRVEATADLSDGVEKVASLLGHELLHYRFQLLDEYMRDRFRFRAGSFSDPVPYVERFNYGVMDNMGWRSADHPPYASTAENYRGYSSFRQLNKTWQYEEWHWSAWDQIREFLRADLANVQWRGGSSPNPEQWTLFRLRDRDLDPGPFLIETPSITFELVPSARTVDPEARDRGILSRAVAAEATDEPWPLLWLRANGNLSTPVLLVRLVSRAEGAGVPSGYVAIGATNTSLSFAEHEPGSFESTIPLMDGSTSGEIVGRVVTVVPQAEGGTAQYASWFRIAALGAGRLFSIDQRPVRFSVDGNQYPDSTLAITWAMTLDCGQNCGANVGPAMCGVATATEPSCAGVTRVSYLYDSSRGASCDSLAICSWDEDLGSWTPIDSLTVRPLEGEISGEHGSTGLFALRTLSAQRDTVRPGRIGDLVGMTGLGTGAIELDWSASGDDSTSGAPTAYVVAWSDSVITTTNWADQQSSILADYDIGAGGHLLGSVKVGEASKAYNIAICAIDDAGNVSLASNNCRVVSGRGDPNLAPAAPSVFVADDNPFDHGRAIRLRWHLSADDDGGKMTVRGYNAFRRDRITRESVLIAELAAGVSTYLDTLVSSGRLYDYWISAVDSIQESTSQREFAVACADSGALAGDFSSDARVDLRDLTLLAPHLDVSADSTRYDALYDVISDSRIDEEDADFVAAAFGSGLPIVGDPSGDNAAARLVLKVSHGASDSTIVDVCVSGSKNLAGYSFTLAFPDADGRLVGSIPYDGILSGTSLTSRGAWAPLRTVRQPEAGLLHIARVVTDPDETLAASGTAWLERIVFSGKGGIDLSMNGAAVIDCKSRVNVLGWDVSNVTDRDVPGATVLFQSRPNPFNGRATIQYRVGQRGQVNVAIYDLRGRKVRQLVQEAQVAGDYTVTWDAKDGQGRSVASGCYFCKMITEDYDQTRKVMLVK